MDNGGGGSSSGSGSGEPFGMLLSDMNGSNEDEQNQTNNDRGNLEEVDGAIDNGATTDEVVVWADREKINPLIKTEFNLYNIFMIAKYGSGKDVLIDLSTVDLSMLSASSDFNNNIGSIEPLNTQRGFPNTTSLIIGSAIFTYMGNNQVEINVPDRFNFEMHEWTIGNVPRNVGTAIGSVLLYTAPFARIDYTPFNIYFYGRGRISD